MNADLQNQLSLLRNGPNVVRGIRFSMTVKCSKIMAKCLENRSSHMQIVSVTLCHKVEITVIHQIGRGRKREKKKTFSFLEYLDYYLL